MIKTLIKRKVSKQKSHSGRLETLDEEQHEELMETTNTSFKRLNIIHSESKRELDYKQTRFGDSLHHLSGLIRESSNFPSNKIVYNKI